jgi:hypothetical protein
VSYDPDDRNSAVLAIVDAISQVSGARPEELTPLHDVLDTDALTQVLSSCAGSRLTVEFTFEGYPVLVSGRGEVVVQPPP